MDAIYRNAYAEASKRMGPRWIIDEDFSILLKTRPYCVLSPDSAWPMTPSLSRMNMNRRKQQNVNGGRH